ncbi:MAG TPA: DUF418 domain-containing protein [Metabacillus sp.]|nr:DUF418 domain-containing protein [Metabacillus sp.]
MNSFYSPEFIETMFGISPHFEGIDNIIHLFYQLFIKMKFYPIFALLFGLGFYLFLHKGFSMILFFKRMVILFFIGMIHLIFFWYGDILHVYALTSIFLVLFYKVPSKWILCWVAGLLMVYHLFISWNLLISTSSLLESNDYSNMLSTYVSIYKESPYFEWVWYRLKIEVIPILYQFPFVFVPVLAWFLLGLYIGKEKMYERNPSNIKRVKFWWRISFYMSIGFIILNVLALIYWPNILYSLTSISGVVLAILYLTSIYLFFDHPFVMKVLYPLSYVGRMSLSNYLFQSVFLISFFRMFDLYNKISLTEGLIISIVVFLFQMIISKYWLSYFHQGPIEWIWRSMTLKKISPFLKK